MESDIQMCIRDSSYGFAFTSSDLDAAVKSLSDIMPYMLRLAEVEKSCKLMSAEIETTRRRVNALDHVMIPQYEETIKYLSLIHISQGFWHSDLLPA